MNKLVAPVALAGLLLASSNVSAQSVESEDWAEKTGAIGIGVARVTGTPRTGLSLRLYPTDIFGLELGFGMSINSTRDRNADADIDNRVSVRDIDLSLLGEVDLVTSNRATLGAYGGIGFTSHGASNKNIEGVKQTDGYNDLAFELGLRGEVFLYKFFSIHGRVGLVLDPENDQEREFGQEADEDTKRTGMNVDFMRGDLLGAFGFTFWIPVGGN